VSGSKSAAVDTMSAARTRADETVDAIPRDRAGFEAAVRPHYEPLLRRLTLVLGDREDAEDAAQEAYLRAAAWIPPVSR
jgi:DNA-directed RNA polymerase specialized sigma24 family protein